jgi:uncharacterized protein YyaL (SSP411 family)
MCRKIPLSPLLLLCLFSYGPTGCGERDARPVNHLAGETSPYLRLHARNPVDWYPWGEAALDKARREQKMLIVSIGYAACHWCHVMERESFSDTAVARLMNEHFVAVKVDREERPDVDGVYLTACQLAGGGACGWPLNAFALPDGRPVWSGTYFPKKQWIEILRYFITLQQQEPDKLDRYAGRLLADLARADGIELPPAPEAITERATFARRLVDSLLRQTDWRHGGVQGAPKFPMPAAWELLLARHRLRGDTQALRAVRVTLNRLAAGGLYDHLGGGFARYAVDERWHVPHFEKMLYDNAQLVSLYAHAYQVTGAERYRETIVQTLGFVARELTSPEGAFFSSIEADSEGAEGKYYVWRKAEVDSLLDPRSAELLTAYYGLTAEGNWERGKNILDPDRPVGNVAAELGLEPAAARRLLAAARARLLDARERRPRPRCDDKAISAWNALMIQGYLDAYHALGDTAYLDVARRNANFLLDRQLDVDGRLRRSYRDGRSGVNGFLDDYALTARAFIGLYQATFEDAWLHRAQRLVDYALANFSDDSTGLFFYTSGLDPPLVVRRRDFEDNVIPSSNSTMARVLYDLGLYFYRDDYLERARAMLDRVAADPDAPTDPVYFANWGRLALDLADPPFEVAIVGPEAGRRRRELLRRYLPQARVLGGTGEGRLELLEGKYQPGRTLIYVCQNKVCKMPVEEVEAAWELIEIGNRK